MNLNNLKVQLQRHFSDGLVIIVGSGLSCAEGIPVMRELADHLCSSIDPALSQTEKLWWEETAPLIASIDLQAALLLKPPAAKVEASIVAATSRLIADAERAIIEAVFANGRTLRFTRLLGHLLKPSAGIAAVTTNYDRLLEVAAEAAGLGVDTLFVGQFAGQLNEQESRKGKSVQYRYLPPSQRLQTPRKLRLVSARRKAISLLGRSHRIPLDHHAGPKQISQGI